MLQYFQNIRFHQELTIFGWLKSQHSIRTSTRRFQVFWTFLTGFIADRQWKESNDKRAILIYWPQAHIAWLCMKLHWLVGLTSWPARHCWLLIIQTKIVLTVQGQKIIILKKGKEKLPISYLVANAAHLCTMESAARSRSDMKVYLQDSFNQSNWLSSMPLAIINESCLQSSKLYARNHNQISQCPVASKCPNPSPSPLISGFSKKLTWGTRHSTQERYQMIWQDSLS